ncbi:serpin B6-like [Gracilinanus agilis]|uniref:serpin B6-like n=1 Tax=Gracilinanus agilis TaxID=191870 RepID=UPI001CFF295F|nr:serpin B6-like [Gracilinanus agilis]
MPALSEANNTFALNFFKKIEIGEENEENVFYSPLSLYHALTMVLEGATGETAEQIQQVLSLSKNTDVHQSFQSFLAEVNKTGAQPLMRVANALFGEKTCGFLSPFKESCQKFYFSNVEELDFAHTPEAARKHINDWVEEKTEGKISELLANDSIDIMTNLVLVNAIYFNGKWEKPFDKAKTAEKMFKISEKKQKPVQMMYQRSTFSMTFIEDIPTQILVLPYAGGHMDMVILLPVENKHLKMLKKRLTSENLVDWINPEMMNEIEVEVFLPKFILAEHLDVEIILQKLGMLDAFDKAKADFSKMSARNDLCLSKVIHKAYVEVNEEGTVAVSSTSAVMMTRSERMSLEFKADHPFIFYLIEKQTNKIVFIGEVTSP